MNTKILLQDIFNKKQQGQKISMLTAYDYAMAVLVDRAGVDVILVGDSLANVVLGLESTAEVGMAEMMHHTKAVLRGVKVAPVVADMPFESYQKKGADFITSAKRFIDAGCAAVKVEWFDDCLNVVKLLVKSGVPVVGHLGLTPQTAAENGGFKVRGRDAATAALIIDQAMLLEKEGCLALVLECIPEQLAQDITAKLIIPTIGIGAGRYCDGQVLVIHDILGLYDRKSPKFVKRYVDIGSEISGAVRSYKREVEDGSFPGPEQVFH